MGEYPGKGLTALFTMIDAAIPNAVNAGIVGNTAHKSGYHRSRNRLLALGNRDDYSIQAAADKRGPGDACCGLDVSWPFEYMKLVTQRVIDASKANDPRLYALREIIGTLDGKRVTVYNRVATGSGSRSKVGVIVFDSSSSSWDSIKSHLWHNHFSILREFADDIAACKAIGAVATGLPLPPVVVPKIIINGKEYDDIPSVSVAAVNSARDSGTFSPHVFYVQKWIGEDSGLTAEMPGRAGYWDSPTQFAFNGFRISLGWTGSDAIGGVGLTSLSTLASKAGSTKPVRA